MKNFAIKKLNQLAHLSRLGMVLSICLLLGMMAACKPTTDTKPVHLTRANTCAVCGMIVYDYPGPHVQIAWKDGKRTFYCDLHEVMPQLLNSAEAARAAAVYVQNFDGLKWGSYKNHWFKARDAIYVIDSNKKSSMGISYVPFKSMKHAKAFQKENGGKIVRYDQINREVLKETQNLMVSKPDLYGSPRMKMKNGQPMKNMKKEN